MRIFLFASFTLALGFHAACATSKVDEEPGATTGDGGPNGEGGTSGSSGEGGVPGEGGSGEGGSSGTSGSPRIACGPTFCRSDQKCDAGVCTFPCTGTQVPGDYATMSQAVTALATTGVDATICYKAQLTTESVSVTDPAAHGKVLKIIGVSSDKSAVGSLNVSTGFASVEMTGVYVQGGLTVSGAKATLRGLRIGNTTSNPAFWAQQVSGKTTDVTIDGCDIGAFTSGYAVRVDNTVSTPTIVSLTNSYLHGGSYGFYVTGAGSQLTLTIVNNLIDKEIYGAYLAHQQGAVVFANNIVSNHTNTGINVANASALTSPSSFTSTNNALYGNIANYAGLAADGPGYVKADCQMDTTTVVPQTKPRSPCRGAGDPKKAPPVDFWNAPRGGSVDIGAVQGP